MPAQQLFDGHDAMTGMSGGNPDTLTADRAAMAVNRFFRSDKNRQRLPFRGLILSFADAKTKTNFEQGNLQGAFFYQGRPPTTGTNLVLKSKLSFPNYLFVSVGGHLFSILLQGGTGLVTQLPDVFYANNPLLMHAWFAQGYEWLIMQDGESNPIIWNGQDTTKAANYYRSNPANGQVPVGAMMTVVYGQLVVTSSDGRNQIAVGDQAYSNNQTNSTDILKFTDIDYWQEGGYFSTAASLGNITGICPMPYLDTGTGQNELVVLCEQGATSFDLSGLRSNWVNQQVQRISLVGMGCISSHSPVTLNGDLIFKAVDGIRSYQNSRIEFSQGFTQAPMSYDVNYWLNQENQSLLEFNCQVAFNNMLFTSVVPMLSPSKLPGCGYHRYHRGMLAYDCDPQSKIEGDNPDWQGLWTGPRPTAFVDGFDSGVHRAFCFSFDADGVNRIYEFMKGGETDTSVTNGRPTKKTIVSFYDTGKYACGTDRYTHKRLIGGNIELSDIHGQVKLDVSYAPDYCPCYIPFRSATIGSVCVSPTCANGGFQFKQPGWGRVNLGNPANVAAPGGKTLASVFRSASFRIKLTGKATVDRFSIIAEPKDQANKQTQPGELDVPIITTTSAPDEWQYSLP